MFKFLVVSLSLHFLVLSLTTESDAPIDSPPKIELTLETKTEKVKKFIESNDGFDFIKCNMYHGIGIIYNIYTNKVDDVAPNSPAMEIGIRKGDTVLIFQEDKAQLTLMVNGKTHTLIKDSICLE